MIKSRCTVFLALLLAAPLSAQDWGRDGDLMKALDVDGDGTLSATEVAEATSALRLLDDDGDGKLSRDEIGIKADSWSGSWGSGTNDKKAPLDPGDLQPEDGAAAIPDRATFDRMSISGEEILGQPGYQIMKFVIKDALTDAPKVYFLNTKNHNFHPGFLRAIGRPLAKGDMRGELVFRPLLASPSGKPGTYTMSFEMQSAFPFERVEKAYRWVTARAPITRERLIYHAMGSDQELYIKEKDRYEAAGLPVVVDDEMFGNIGYLPLNVATSFGRLRAMKPGERPGPRDVVIYRNLPNEMPRVAGVITSVRQTPLSHVNLRAVQDGVPNAFVIGADKDPTVSKLIGKYVRYEVANGGYQLREATQAEVDEYFAALRPDQARIPVRDVTVKDIRSLDDLGFADKASVGIKAANLAAMRRFGLPDGVIPNGYAIPFHFYDAFMKHNDLYVAASNMIATDGFGSRAEKRVEALATLRRQICAAPMPPRLKGLIGVVQKSFPVNTPIRCRSSTNAEDLQDFSGAGLYDSFTHRPNEGHLAKSIKQVFASLWTYRAYEERAFHRIDHFATAMGVLLHPAYKDERANGVAVSEDVLYKSTRQRGRSYYINTQLGENLITNPETDTIPEELLLSPRFRIDDLMIQRSNKVPANEQLLKPATLDRLRLDLKTIHREFRKLYGMDEDALFAMEIEFKVTREGNFAIKQARPWVR